MGGEFRKEKIMQLVVWLKNASLHNLEQLEGKIRQMENVDDVISIVGDEPMRLTKSQTVRLPPERRKNDKNISPQR